MTAAAETFDGGCDCRRVRYRLASRPLFVHACHCRWCQRESGSAFALNAMIESDRVVLLGEAPELVDTPSASGKGQRIARCPHCRIALWSHYAGAGRAVSFVRVGTLDDPDAMPPAWNNNGLSQGTSSAAYLTGKQWGAWNGRLAVGIMGIGFGGTAVGMRIDESWHERLYSLFLVLKWQP